MNFCSKKLFRATIANADIESLKSLYTFLTKCLYHMLVKFEQMHIVPILHEILSFLTKNQAFLKSFLTKR